MSIFNFLLGLASEQHVDCMFTLTQPSRTVLWIDRSRPLFQSCAKKNFKIGAFPANFQINQIKICHPDPENETHGHFSFQ